jgi:hypothetical protein
MAKGNTFCADLLKLIFQAVNISLIADNTATTPLTSLSVSLHNADPGPAGNQTTNETAYTGYARVGVARTSGGWSISGQTISPVSTISFGACTGGTDTITHWAIGTASSGTGKILYVGAIGTNEGPGVGLTADNTIRVPGNTFSVGNQVSFITIPGFALPGGITDGTVYFIKTVSGSTITISTTNGGSTLTITSDGVANVFIETPISVSSGVTPQLTTSSTVTET